MQIRGHHSREGWTSEEQLVVEVEQDDYAQEAGLES